MTQYGAQSKKEIYQRKNVQALILLAQKNGV
jgi:hypothetical protein